MTKANTRPGANRREFLRTANAAAAAGLFGMLARSELAQASALDAFEQSAVGVPDTIFIEVNLRDQWDFGHVFVAPGMTGKGDLLKRGEGARGTALFFRDDELTAATGTNHVLTPQSLPLLPHLNDIAVFDTCEMAIGRIHGHEASNASRSPGRSFSEGAGRLPMWLHDCPGSESTAGNEVHFSSTPTPACLHNWMQRTASPWLRNGITLKFISRNPVHTAFHFTGALPGGQLDRVTRRADVRRYLQARNPGLGGKSLDVAELDRFASLMDSIESRMANRRGYDAAARAELTSHRAAVLRRLRGARALGAINDPSGEQMQGWTLDVSRGAQSQITDDMRIGDLFGYAHSMVASSQVRTVALEWDYLDFHGARIEPNLRDQANMTVLPLVRLIEALKAGGLWHRSLIALYTLDGSRSPNRESYGDEGKNSVILAGGMIRGGYYGDIRIAGAEPDGSPIFSYHSPDVTTGLPAEIGAVGCDTGKRLPGAVLWRTVAAALGVPEEVQNAFPDVREHKPFSRALRI